MKYFDLEKTSITDTKLFYQWWDQLMAHAFNGSPITMPDPKMGSPKFKGKGLTFYGFRQYCVDNKIIDK